jgi:hypothetical protein
MTTTTFFQHKRRSTMVVRSRMRLLALLATLLLAGRVRQAIACSPLDPGACIDGAQYNFWEGVAQNLWSADRALLQLTYSIHQFRWWVVEVAYGFVYDLLARSLGPLGVQLAIIAIVLAILLFVLLPVVGKSRIVDLRHALLWTVLAPSILTLVGPQLVTLEQARTAFSGLILEQGAEAITSVPLFGAAASDMTEPEPLYPANFCGNGELQRRDAGVRPDDLAAALAGASAQDIHCPDKEGPSSTLPDAFFEQGGPVEFATTLDVGNDLTSNDRKRAIERIQAGVTRLTLMLLPCLLAVLDALVQLIFALCLIALWLGLPVGLLVVYFQQTSHAVTGLFRQTVRVLQVSWTSSALLGIVLICLRATAELTNASAYAGFAVGALLLTCYFLVVAFQTLGQCVMTLNDTVLTATGLSVTQPATMTGSAVTGGAALAAGTAVGAGGLALTYALAQRQTGSGRLALTAAAGRFEPLMEAGQVANAMGFVSDTTADALYAGQRSAENLYQSRKLLAGIGRRQGASTAAAGTPPIVPGPLPTSASGDGAAEPLRPDEATAAEAVVQSKSVPALALPAAPRASAAAPNEPIPALGLTAAPTAPAAAPNEPPPALSAGPTTSRDTVSATGNDPSTPSSAGGRALQDRLVLLSREDERLRELQQTLNAAQGDALVATLAQLNASEGDTPEDRRAAVLAQIATTRNANALEQTVLTSGGSAALVFPTAALRDADALVREGYTLSPQGDDQTLAVSPLPHHSPTARQLLRLDPAIQAALYAPPQLAQSTVSIAPRFGFRATSSIDGGVVITPETPTRREDNDA